MRPEVVCSFRTLCKILELNISGKTRFENLLKIVEIKIQLFHSPLLDMNYALVGYSITSYPTRAHRIIVI